MKRNSVCFFLVILLASLCFLPLLRESVAAERVAALTPDALPEDMRDLQIQEQYAPSSFKQAGVIHSLEGFVVVLHRSTREAFLGTEGDPIHENDEFYTLPDSRCRLHFTNEDVVSLAPETRFSVDEYRSDEEKAEKTSFFSMLKGKAMFYAMRLFRTKKKNFQVNTPTAVMGVRGTKFGAHVYRIEDKAAQSRAVQVADSGRGMGPLLAQTGGGGKSVTVVACGDGSVGVNGTALGPGQYYNSYTGTVGYDPSVLGGIEGATGGSGGDGDEGGGDDTGGGGTDNGDMVNALTTIVQTQGGEGAHGEEGQTVVLTKYGYFAALLQDTGMSELEDVFLVMMANVFGEGAPHRADSLPDSDYLIWDGPYSFVTTNDGASEHTINVELTATQVSSGYNYLAYGYWQHTGGNSFTGSGPYSFVDYSWWLEGWASPVDVIAQQKGSIAYSGEAYGTMYYDGTTTQLDGGFSSTANFDSARIENFHLNVKGAGGRYATVNGGSGDIAADGTFGVSGGTWEMYNGIDTINPSHYGAYGRLFGPNVDEIGGAWAMEGTGTYHTGAAGVFGGKRQN